MEHLILKVLSFDLSVPTPLTFITAMCISNKLNEKTMYLAMVSLVAHLVAHLHFYIFVFSILANYQCLRLNRI